MNFDDLVTAATVGVSRKPLPPGVSPDSPDADDPAAALLDAAALQTVARRAGYQPPRGVTVAVPPAAGQAPVFSARAARALREACGWQAGRFPADSRLLPDLLRAAADAGYAAYPTLLPALLNAATRRTALRGPVAAVLGRRGRWLARHRPDWKWVTAEPGEPGDPEIPTAAEPPEEQARRLARRLAATHLTTVNPPGWGGRPSPLIEEIRDWPGPWPPVLASAVLAAIVSVGSHPRLPSAARILANEAGRGLPAAGERDYAFRLARMADTCPHAWAPDLQAASETILLRRTFLKEIGDGG